MLPITYYYLHRTFKDPNTKKDITIYYPAIPIMLSYNRTIKFKAYFDCLLDSGSDTNLFPADWGQLSGITIKKGIHKTIKGIGNAPPIEAWTHKVKFYIGSQSIDTDVDFSFEQKIPLLGRLGFFDKFNEIIFEEKLRKVTLK